MPKEIFYRTIEKMYLNDRSMQEDAKEVLRAKDLFVPTEFHILLEFGRLKLQGCLSLSPEHYGTGTINIPLWLTPDAGSGYYASQLDARETMAKYNQRVMKKIFPDMQQKGISQDDIDKILNGRTQPEWGSFRGPTIQTVGGVTAIHIQHGKEKVQSPEGENSLSEDVSWKEIGLKNTTKSTHEDQMRIFMAYQGFIALLREHIPFDVIGRIEPLWKLDYTK